MLELKPIDINTREEIVKFIEENWGGTIIISKGKTDSAANLPGFVVIEDTKLKGIITYNIDNEECEIVSLDSLSEKQGIGSMLINRVIEEAKLRNCKRVWLVTTNDNTNALRFYQRRGFNFAGIYLNSIREARKIKPQIPLTGFDDIPILHEIEFETVLHFQ